MHFNRRIFSSTSRAASIPLGRAGSVSDVSSTIRFLLSSDSEFINGETIRCDVGDLINDFCIQKITRLRRCAANLADVKRAIRRVLDKRFGSSLYLNDTEHRGCLKNHYRS